VADSFARSELFPGFHAAVTATAAATLTLRNSEDIVRMRQAIREHAISQGFSLVDQTKLVTAASEIGRNTVIYGGGGEVAVTLLATGARKGVKLIFADHGPGIPDIALALRDGYTSGTGLGLGLGGARRLSSEFDIESRPGEGTRVTLVRWR
jgi:serine/threonine-protein kinase RsbT